MNEFSCACVVGAAKFQFSRLGACKPHDSTCFERKFNQSHKSLANFLEIASSETHRWVSKALEFGIEFSSSRNHPRQAAAASDRRTHRAYANEEWKRTRSAIAPWRRGLTHRSIQGWRCMQMLCAFDPPKREQFEFESALAIMARSLDENRRKIFSSTSVAYFVLTKANYRCSGRWSSWRRLNGRQFKKNLILFGSHLTIYTLCARKIKNLPNQLSISWWSFIHLFNISVDTMWW